MSAFRSSLFRFFAVFLVLSVTALKVHAWGSQGHQVIAQIAYNHLDPQVKAKCNALLAIDAPCGTSSTSFVSTATWADQRCDSTTSSEHFIDIPISLDGASTNSFSYSSINIVNALLQEIAVLQNPASTLTDQATALRYMIHFVGDIEQPLHCSTGISASKPSGDAGGNGFLLSSGNLHSFWDGGGGYLTNGASVSSQAADVESTYSYSLSVGSIPNPMDWAAESWNIARTNVYVGITQNSTLSAAYTNSTRAITKQRMAIGGQRLAKLLNTLFATNAPTVVSTKLGGGNVKLTFSAVTGRAYQVQYKTLLTETNWNSLTNITATTTSITFTNTVSQSQRFYRTVVVN